MSDDDAAMWEAALVGDDERAFVELEEWAPAEVWSDWTDAGC
jgi:hypothetical protein